MVEDLSGNLPNQDESYSAKVQQVGESNLQEKQKPINPKSLITSFFNKYKLSIILIVVVLIVGILLIIYLIFIYKPKTQVQTPTQLPKAELILDEPKDQQAITSAQITISGRTNPNSQVVAYTDTNEEILESDNNGNWRKALAR